MKFSAIIPAHNEWPRIQKVLEIACQSDLLDEVIVIDDGSTDDTKKKIEQFKHNKLRPIFLAKNGGKTHAVMTGILACKSDYIVMIDSDLIGLESRHIDQLIAPVKNDEANTTLSLRDNSLWIYKIFWTDFVSGERVVPKKIFTENESFFRSGKGFSLEVFLNEKILENHFVIKNIVLSGVITPRKSDKMGFLKGLKSDVKMIIEIVSSLSLWRIMRQFFLFSRFSSRTKSKNHQK